MFKDRFNAGPFLVRDFDGIKNDSCTPQIGDVATVKLEENGIQLQVALDKESKDEWGGEVVRYQLLIQGRTPSERLDEINEQEEFLMEKDISVGSVVSFPEIKIHTLSR